jgi:hypothetical protein
MILETIKPPYYAMIFSSVRTGEDFDYDDISEKMLKLVKQQKGFFEFNQQ